MAAPPGKQGLEIAGTNFVANDLIWKGHCDNERSQNKNWYNDWGFLTQPYKEVIKDEMHKYIDSHRPKAEIPAHMQIPPVTPISSYIKVGPSPKPVPKTTSGQIGWRSSQQGLILEKYGRYTKPKGSILKQLNWPAEAMG